jgi:hypothetical protein
MREEDALDAMIERMAREEQDDINRKQAETLLGMFEEETRRRQDDPVLKFANEVLRRAQAEASEASASRVDHDPELGGDAA